MVQTGSKFVVNMEFYAVKLPPVRDILVLGKKYPQGKVSIMECFRFIAPDEFDVFDIDDPEEVAEAVVVNKRILKRMSADQLISVLKEQVFPFISPGEAINVNLDIKIRLDNLEIDRNR